MFMFHFPFMLKNKSDGRYMDHLIKAVHFSLCIVSKPCFFSEEMANKYKL